jgi:hypothetical protein
VPAKYPPEMKEEFETMNELICFLKSIGFAYETLDGLLDVPSGVVKIWILRGPDGFHPSLIDGWYRSIFWLILILCSFLGICDRMERETLNRISDDHTWERQEQYWNGFYKDIISLGGVSPFVGGYQEEEATIVPNNFIRRMGVEPNRIAQILADYFPGYGVKTEQDFYDICERYENFQLSSRLKKNRL